MNSNLKCFLPAAELLILSMFLQTLFIFSQSQTRHNCFGFGENDLTAIFSRPMCLRAPKYKNQIPLKVNILTSFRYYHHETDPQFTISPLFLLFLTVLFWLHQYIIWSVGRSIREPIKFILTIIHNLVKIFISTVIIMSRIKLFG